MTKHVQQGTKKTNKDNTIRRRTKKGQQRTNEDKQGQQGQTRTTQLNTDKKRKLYF